VIRKAIFAIALLLPPLFPMQPPLYAQTKTVKIGTLHLPPNIDQTLPDYGFVGELMRAVFEPAGYRVEITVGPWARVFEGGKTGFYDAVWPSIMTEERKRWFDFSDVAVESKYVLLTRKDKPVDFRSFSDLTKYTIGVLRGGATGSELDTMTGLKTIEGASFSDNIRMLLAGRIDAMTAEFFTVQYLLNTEFGSEAPRLAYAGKDLSNISLYLMVSKKSAQGKAVIADFNAGLAGVKASGLYARLLEKYRMRP